MVPIRKKMKVREVLGSNEERKFQAHVVLDSKRLDFVSRDEPTAKKKICSSELVLILWHVHTLTQTKV